LSLYLVIILGAPFFSGKTIQPDGTCKDAYDEAMDWWNANHDIIKNKRIEDNLASIAGSKNTTAKKFLFSALGLLK
jgi:hypothetical protein